MLLLVAGCDSGPTYDDALQTWKTETELLTSMEREAERQLASYDSELAQYDRNQRTKYEQAEMSLTEAIDREKALSQQITDASSRLKWKSLDDFDKAKSEWSGEEMTNGHFLKWARTGGGNTEDVERRASALESHRKQLEAALRPLSQLIERRDEAAADVRYFQGKLANMEKPEAVESIIKKIDQERASAASELKSRLDVQRDRVAKAKELKDRAEKNR